MDYFLQIGPVPDDQIDCAPSGAFERKEFSVLTEAGSVGFNSKKKKKKKERAYGSYVAPGLYSSPYSSRKNYPERVVMAFTYPAPFVYAIFDTAASAISFLAQRSAQAKHAFIYIEAGEPVSCYFDMERPRNVAPLLAGGSNDFFSACRLAIALFVAYMNSVYAHGITEHYDGHWEFYSACTEAKYSAHVHSRLTFANVETLKNFISRFHELLVHLYESGEAMVAPLFYMHPTTGKPACIVDHLVYTPRPFRMPLSCKSVDSTNFLMPLGEPVVGPPALVENVHECMHDTYRRLASGFIHPSARLHVLYPVLPKDPVELRRRLCSKLLYNTVWPLPSLSALDGLVKELFTMCSDAQQLPVPTDWEMSQAERWQQIEPDTAEALRTTGIVSVERVSSGMREHWLIALAMLTQLIAGGTDWDDENAYSDFAPFARRIVQSSFEHSVGTPDRAQRVSNIAHVEAPPPSSRDVVNTRYNLFCESAFASFYMRSLHYHTNIYKADEEQALFSAFIGGDNTGMTAADTLMADYARFERLPMHIFSIPEQTVSIAQMARISEQDPLSCAGASSSGSTPSSLSPASLQMHDEEFRYYLTR